MATRDFPLEPTWRPLIHDLGARPADVLRRAQLPEDLFAGTNVRLTTDEYFRFWESLGAEVNDPLFPIRIVEVATAETFMPPFFAALCSPNLRVAMQRLSKYKRLVAPMILHVDDKPGALVLSLEWLDATVVPPPSLGAMELAFIIHLARMGTRERIRPMKAAAPSPPKSAGEFKRFLGVPVEQGKRVVLWFSKADAELPFLTANESVWSAFEPQLRKRLAQLDDAATMSDRVRAALLEALPSGQASVVTVAERLAMSKRTLQRRLSGEGTSFQAVLNTTRHELASHYLSKTSLSCAEISFLLGFDDPNSFFRAFHEWTGKTPEGVRQALH